MSNLLYGKGYLTTSGDASLFFSGSPGGYVTPLIPAPEIVDEADDIKMLKDVFGIVEGIIAANDCILTATFAFIPRGATRDLARQSATIPPLGTVEIVGLPIVKVRRFVDAFNTNGDDTQPWYYFGGGSLKGAEDGKDWGGTITLKRFYNVRGGAIS